jgi:hypothetical protein
MALFGKSRSQKRAENNLGVVHGDTMKNRIYRRENLHEICKYIDGTQYDHLLDWEACLKSDTPAPIKKRKPIVIYPFAQVLAERVASKLLGKSTFPKLNIPDDPDTEEFMGLVVKSTYLKSLMLKSIEKLITHGSLFVRFKVVGGNLKFEYYNSKYCYPKFDDTGELESIEIKYIYDDEADLDDRGKPRKKWYKMELGKMKDILFDNPYYHDDRPPEFKPVSSADHQLGFVQGQWFRTGWNKHTPDADGKTIVEKLFGFIDELNYSLSQSCKATSYGQDPQLVINGMDEDEVDDLIKSASKSWLLGMEGQAQFLELNGNGVKTAQEQRNELMQMAQDIGRVVFLDPEKIVGSAQSAKAMEVLHGPLVELVNELRPHTEKGLIGLLQKALAALIVLNKRGMPLIFNMPPQYQPASLDIEVNWPAIFELTTQDKQQIISMFSQLTSSNIISRETALRNIMAKIPDLIVDDVEAELNRVNTQQQFNTFGF